MKFASSKLVGLVVVIFGATLCFNSANAAALWVTSFESRLPFSGCVQEFDRILNRLGMKDINGDQTGRGGTLGTTRAHVVCVRRQKAGPCNRDGLTVVITAAGDTVNAARDTVNQIRKAYGNPVLFDCN